MFDANWIQGDYKGYNLVGRGDFDALRLEYKDRFVLELRIRGTATVAARCGLYGEDIHKWLFDVAIDIAKDLQPRQIEYRLISEYDIDHGKLNRDWRSLRTFDPLDKDTDVIGHPGQPTGS